MKMRNNSYDDLLPEKIKYVCIINMNDNNKY